MLTPIASVSRGYQNATSGSLAQPYVQSFHFAQRGDIPQGKHPALFNGPTQMPTQVDLVAPAYFDGSWSCGQLAAIIPDTLAANGSVGDTVNYQIKPVAGAPDSTPKFSLAAWDAANDVRLTFRTNFLDQSDDANNWEFKVSDCVAAGIIQGLGTGSGYPLYSYRTDRSGPVVMSWMFRGYMRRKSDGAYHTQLVADIYVDALSLTDMLIHCVLEIPRAVDTGAANPLQTVGGVTKADLAPMTGVAELSNNGSVLHRWGGPTDFRTYTLPATTTDLRGNLTVATVDVTNSQIVLPSTIRQLNAVGYVFTSTGTLPGGMVPGRVYWTTGDGFGQRVWLLNARAWVNPGGVGATRHLWAANAPVLAGGFFDAYWVGSIGDQFRTQRWFAKNAGTTGSTPPVYNGSLDVLDGTVHWTPQNVIFTDAGTGTLSAYPVVHVFPQCETHLVDEANAGRIWTGAGPAPRVHNIIDVEYHLRYARALPPYDLTIPTVYTNDLTSRWTSTKFGTHSTCEPSVASQIDNFGDNPGQNLVGYLNYTNTLAMLAQADVSMQWYARSEALRWGDHWCTVEDPRSFMPVVGQAGLGNVPGAPYPGLGPSMTAFYYAGAGVAGQYNGIGLGANGSYYDAKYARRLDDSHLPAMWVWSYHSTGDVAYLDMGIDLANGTALSNADNGFGRTWTYNGRKYCCTVSIFNQVRGQGWGTRCLDVAFDVTPATHPMRSLMTDIWFDTEAAAVAMLDYLRVTIPTIYDLGAPWMWRNGNRMQTWFVAIWLLAMAQAARKGRGQGGWRTVLEHICSRFYLPLYDDAGPGNVGLVDVNDSLMQGNCTVTQAAVGDVITLQVWNYRWDSHHPVAGMPTTTYTVTSTNVAAVAQGLTDTINGFQPFVDYGFAARFERNGCFNTRLPSALFDPTKNQGGASFRFPSSGTGTVVTHEAPIFQYTQQWSGAPRFTSMAEILDYNLGTGWPKSNTLQLACAGSGTGSTIDTLQLPYNTDGWFPWGTTDYLIFARMTLSTLAEAGIQGPKALGFGSSAREIAANLETRFQTAFHGPPKLSGITTGGNLGSGTRTYANFDIRTWSAQAQFPTRA